MTDNTDLLREIATKIKSASKVGVLTGAGISAESGVPTFRDPGGLWDKYRPEDLANENAFRSDPELVSNWYHFRRQKILSVNPNPGHLALVELEKIVTEFLLVTQNVDRLHQRAGQKNVIEVHGSIVEQRCIECGTPADDEQMKITEGIVNCHKCEGLMRPGVVWFGESLPQKAISDAFEYAQHSEVFLVVGTSGVVYPAAQVPIEALNSGASVFEFNLEETALTSYMSQSVFGPSGETLPKLIEILKKL